MFQISPIDNLANEMIALIETKRTQFSTTPYCTVRSYTYSDGRINSRASHKWNGRERRPNNHDHQPGSTHC